MLQKVAFILLIIVIITIYIILTSNTIKSNTQIVIKTIEKVPEKPIQNLQEAVITETTNLFTSTVFVTTPEIVVETIEKEPEKPIQKLPEAIIIGSPKCGIY
jgi:hypothetical protein